MMFVGQTSKNVHDVRKSCLGTTLCILAFSLNFTLLILDEIYLEGPKLLYNNIWVGNVQANIPMDQPRVLEEGPKLGAKAA